MKNDYAYIGFVCIDNNNKPILVTKLDNNYKISGISDSTLEIGIDEYKALAVVVKYFDGFDSVTLEYAHKNNYNDIIIAIETHGTVLNDGDMTIFDMLYNDFDSLNFFWGFIEEYYETDEGMENFEICVKKDSWNNKK